MLECHNFHFGLIKQFQTTQLNSCFAISYQWDFHQVSLAIILSIAILHWGESRAQFTQICRTKFVSQDYFSIDNDQCLIWIEMFFNIIVMACVFFKEVFQGVAQSLQYADCGRVRFFHFFVSVRQSVLVQLYFYLTMVQNIFLVYVYFGSGSGFVYSIVSACSNLMAYQEFTCIYGKIQ